MSRQTETKEQIKLQLKLARMYWQAGTLTFEEYKDRVAAILELWA